MRGGGEEAADFEARSAKHVIWWLWPTDSKKGKIRLVLAAICLVGAKIGEVSVPIVLSLIVDRLTLAAQGANVISPVFWLLALYAILRVASQGANELRDLLFLKVRSRIVRRLSNQAFQRVQQFDLSYVIGHQTGGLLRKISRGVAAVSFLLEIIVVHTAPTLLETLLVIVVLTWWFGASYGVAVVSIVFIYVSITAFVTEYRMRLREQLNSADDQASSIFAEAIANFEAIRNLNADTFEAKRFAEVQSRYEVAYRKHEVSLKILSFLQHLTVTLGLLWVMSLCIAAVLRSERTVGDLVLLVSYLLQLYLPLDYFGFVYREVKRSLLDASSMFEVLNVMPCIRDLPGACSIAVGPGEIIFEDVSFAYNSERQVLKNFSLRVPARSTYAIVGPSGSGKSTLARLLLRHYSPSHGRILVDGQDIADVTRSSLRKIVGIVPQEAALFNETVGFNISYGRDNVLEDDLFAAVRVADLESLILMTPHGFDTQIGERGLRLSGGERQRIGIARVALSNPPILILDEATSSLDAVTESRVQNSLLSLVAGRTTIMIAHRLSTITTADWIIVLRDGAICEQGIHNDLVNSNGLYASMWRAYMREETSGRVAPSL